MKKLLLLLLFLNALCLKSQENLNRTWFLTELTVAGESIFIPDEESQLGFPTLSILINDAEGQVEGNGICNGFLSSAPVTATAGTITLNISPTLVICDTDDEINFEGAYFNFLGAPESEEFTYDVNGIFLQELSLTLTKNNGDTAVYTATNENPPSSLTQEGWYLDYFELDGVAQNPPSQMEGQENAFSISIFNEQAILDQNYRCFAGGSGEFSAFNYFGSQTISIGILGLLAMDCSIPILNEYDAAFTLMLEGKTHTYEIIEEGEGRQLILTDQNGDRIFYTNEFLTTDTVDPVISFTISPNPTSDIMTITGDNIRNITSYQIIDLQGKVLSQDDFMATIRVNSLPQGLYFLILDSDQSRSLQRFIKN